MVFLVLLLIIFVGIALWIVVLLVQLNKQIRQTHDTVDRVVHTGARFQRIFISLGPVVMLSKNLIRIIRKGRKSEQKNISKK